MAGEMFEQCTVKVEIKVEEEDEPDGEMLVVGSPQDLGMSLDLAGEEAADLKDAKVKVEDAVNIFCMPLPSLQSLQSLPQKQLRKGRKTGLVKKKHECEVCGFKSKTESGLKVHQRRLSHRVKLRCNICDQGFATLMELQAHRRHHHGDEKPFVCDVCGRSYAYKYNLFTHVKTVHLGAAPEKKVHACQLCEKVYSYPRSLRLHMATHLGTNVFICDICGKSLTSKDHLKFHRRIHTGEKPYVCETCGKGFCKSCNLTLHRRVHTGERPYKCDCCQKSFSQRSTLVIHMRLHTGHKPYVCFVCERSFICRALLNVHLKNHSV